MAASRGWQTFLPDNVKTRRNILLIWVAISAVIALGFLGRSHGAFLVSDDSHPKHTPPTAPTLGTALSGAKAAVIVETRMLDNLIPLLMHFSSVLGPTWQVILYTKQSVWQPPSPQGPFGRAVADGRIKVFYLPPDLDMTDYISVSVFWTRPWLWEQLQNVGRVLTFQTDSIVCSKSNVTADDFLEWDYVGAPVNSFLGRGYNGGLSLRNPKKFLEIVRSNSFDEDFKKGSETGDLKIMIEDQWFYTKLLEMPGSKLPGEEVAKKFSVESVWYEEPFAFHQPRRWQKDHLEEIRRYCPEVDMIYK